MILRKLKEAAEAYLGEKVTQAVITVPAYFNDSQRQATKDAGKIAGLEVLRIINEPTAAALAYGLDKKKDETIAVFDLGGGTFDISILEIGEGVFEVKATNGDTHLGGDDFDQRVMDWIADEFKKENGIDLRKDRMALQRLKEAAEKAKCELSTHACRRRSTCPSSPPTPAARSTSCMTLTRAKLESLVADLIERTLGPVPAGHAGRRRDVQGHRRGDPGRRPDPHAEGAGGGEAALRQGAPQGRQPGRGGGGRRRGAGRGAHRRGEGPAPPRRDAAVARHRDAGRRDDPAHHRGNTTIPTKKSETFTTAADNQTSVEVHVLQGERPMARDNRTLGKFHLVGIPPAPRGVPQVEVTFDIDANGILNVSAKDKATGKQQNITITPSSGLTKDEIDRMVKEAEANAAEDAKRKEEIEVRNQTDSLVYSTERTLSEHGDKLAEADARPSRTRSTRRKEALKGEDLERMKQAQEALTKAAHKLAEVMYQAQAQAARPGAGGRQPGTAARPGGAAKGEVVDAEFEDLGDKK